MSSDSDYRVHHMDPSHETSRLVQMSERKKQRKKSSGRRRKGRAPGGKESPESPAQVEGGAEETQADDEHSIDCYA